MAALQPLCGRGRPSDNARSRRAGAEIFVPLVFAPGEAFQFGWSEDWAILGGERTKLQVAHTKLSHSRVFAVRAYPLQTHEMLFDALTNAFHWLQSHLLKHSGGDLDL